jgi:hypothetical protein
MKKYPDNSGVYEVKKKRRQEIEQLPPIERIKTAKRLQKMAQRVPKRVGSTARDPNWSVASGRPTNAKRKLA